MAAHTNSRPVYPLAIVTPIVLKLRHTVRHERRCCPYRVSRRKNVSGIRSFASSSSLAPLGEMSSKVQATKEPPSPVSSQARWSFSSRCSRRIVKVMNLPSLRNRQPECRPPTSLWVCKSTDLAKTLPDNDDFGVNFILLFLKTGSQLLVLPS